MDIIEIKTELVQGANSQAVRSIGAMFISFKEIYDTSIKKQRNDLQTLL